MRAANTRKTTPALSMLLSVKRVAGQLPVCRHTLYLNIHLGVIHHYKFGRKVCVLGRSMQRNVEIADNLGFLDIPDGRSGRRVCGVNRRGAEPRELQCSV